MSGVSAIIGMVIVNGEGDPNGFGEGDGEVIVGCGVAKSKEEGGVGRSERAKSGDSGSGERLL